MLTRVSLRSFFANTAQLTHPENIPDDRASERNFAINGFNTITLDHMVARVTVVPSNRDYITLLPYGDMAEHLGDEIIGDSLVIAGSTPVGKQGAIRYPRTNEDLFAMTLPRWEDHNTETVAQVNGYAIDWGRAMHLVLHMPANLPLRIRGIIGAIGITAPLHELDFSPVNLTQLIAGPVKKLTGKVKGWGYGRVSEVSEALDMTILPGATGTVDVDLNFTDTMTATILGQGRISHGGVVIGDTTLNLPGRGEIIVARALGETCINKSSQGRIWINGQEE